MNTTHAVRKAFRVQRYRRRYDQMFSIKTCEALVDAINEQFARQRTRYAKDAERKSQQ